MLRSGLLYIRAEEGFKTSLVVSTSRVMPNCLSPHPGFLTSTVREALSQVLNIVEVYCWPESLTWRTGISLTKSTMKTLFRIGTQDAKATVKKRWHHCAGTDDPTDTMLVLEGV